MSYKPKVRLAIVLQSQITSFHIFRVCVRARIKVFTFCNLISHLLEFERSGYYKGKLIFCWNEMRK